MYNLIIFGAPGAGKGTQAEIISEKLGLYHFSTGEYLREAISQGSELGKIAKAIVDKGNLVPDDIMIKIVKEALTNNVKNGGFILDGFPRTIGQAMTLSKIFKELGLNNIKVLHLIVDEKELIRRLQNRGRTDDGEEIIKIRLNVYEKTTKPIIEYYSKAGNVIDIDAHGEIVDVNNKILEKLSI